MILKLEYFKHYITIDGISNPILENTIYVKTKGLDSSEFRDFIEESTSDDPFDNSIYREAKDNLAFPNYLYIKTTFEYNRVVIRGIAIEEAAFPEIIEL